MAHIVKGCDSNFDTLHWTIWASTTFKIWKKYLPQN